MHTPRFLLIALTLLGFATPAFADTWTIDPAHSNIGFSVRHMMISKTKGQFQDFSGKVELNEKDLTKSSVQLEIKAASIDTDDKKRDEHLRGEDFFHVEKHELITFKSTKIKRSGKGYKVTGNLTMHGVTKPVTLDVTLTKPVKTPFDTTARGATVEGELNRKNFGMTWNNTLDAGGLAVGEEVTLDIELELVKQ